MTADQPEPLVRGDLVLLPAQRTIATAAGSARITPQQRDILAALMRAHEPLSRARLLDLLWGDRPDGPLEQIVDVQISHLRRALREIESEVRIVAIRCDGYRLEAPGDAVTVRVYTAAQAAALARILDLVRPTAPDLVRCLQPDR